MTTDEQAGMGWWNALTEEQRAHWLREANTASVAEAWAYYQRVRIERDRAGGLAYVLAGSDADARPLDSTWRAP